MCRFIWRRAAASPRSRSSRWPPPSWLSSSPGGRDFAGFAISTRGARWADRKPKQVPQRFTPAQPFDGERPRRKSAGDGQQPLAEECHAHLDGPLAVVWPPLQQPRFHTPENVPSVEVFPPPPLLTRSLTLACLVHQLGRRWELPTA